MGLINFNPKSTQAAADFNQMVEDLQKQQDRFKYPTSPSNYDELSKLLCFGWKLLYFPVTNLTTEISKDLVLHKYPNRDSARVEDMGRNPFVIKATAVFVNNLKAGPQENAYWGSKTLYPDVYKEFLSTAFENTTGDLDHPFLGTIRCKLHSITPHLDATFRGGELVNCQWIETIDDDNISTTLTTLKSASSDASTAANFINTSFENNNPDPVKLGLSKQAGPNLIKTLNQCKAAIDSANALNQSALHSFDNLEYQCNSIISSCNRLNQSTNAVLKQQAYILKASAKDMRNQTSFATKFVTAIFNPNTPMSWGSLSQFLGNTSDDLIKLNPTLVKKSYIKAGDKVTYYKKTF